MIKLYQTILLRFFFLLFIGSLFGISNEALAQAYIDVPAGYQNPGFITSYNGNIYFTANSIASTNEVAVFKLSDAGANQVPVKISSDFTLNLYNVNIGNNSRLVINGNIYFTFFNILFKISTSNNAVTEEFAARSAPGLIAYSYIVNIYSVLGKIIIQTGLGENAPSVGIPGNIGGAVFYDTWSYNPADGTTIPLVPATPPTDYSGAYPSQFTINKANYFIDFLVFKYSTLSTPTSAGSIYYSDQSYYEVETDGTANGTKIIGSVTKSVNLVQDLGFNVTDGNSQLSPATIFGLNYNFPQFFGNVTYNGLTYSDSNYVLTVNDTKKDASQIAATPLFFLDNNTIYYTGNDPVNGLASIVLLPVETGVQTINFAPLGTKTTVSADFNPGATSNSGLPVTYTVADPTIAGVVSGLIHINKAGVTSITATQPGNSLFYSATPVTQPLTVISQATVYFIAQHRLLNR